MDCLFQVGPVILLFMISIFGFGHEMLLTGLSLYYISLTVKVVC